LSLTKEFSCHLRTNQSFIPSGLDITLDDTDEELTLIYSGALSKWLIIAIPMGNKAGQGVQLNTAGELPAVSGVNLTGIFPSLHIQHKVAASTDGGNSTSGSWQTRPLNTVIKNSLGGSPLSSNQITLGAGTYRVVASAVFGRPDRCQMRLFDITNTASLLLGQTVPNSSSAFYAYPSIPLYGDITLAGTTVLELQYRVETSLATFGLGYGATWGDNVFADIIFEKVG